MELKKVETLKARQKHCVCKMCGGPLELKMIIYNQYGGQGLDLYCNHCGKIEYGIEPDIYASAKQFVDNFEFNYFIEMEENERNYQLNIAKVCDIILWYRKSSGELDENGLTKQKQ